MTQHGPPPTTDDLVARLVHVARDASGGDLSAREQAGVYRLERALLRNAHVNRATPRIAWLLPVAVAAVVGGVAIKRFHRGGDDPERAITYQVVSANVSDGG